MKHFLKPLILGSLLFSVINAQAQFQEIVHKCKPAAIESMRVSIKGKSCILDETSVDISPLGARSTADVFVIWYRGTAQCPLAGSALEIDVAIKYVKLTGACNP